jgi:integrase/recombinase XerD
MSNMVAPAALQRKAAMKPHDNTESFSLYAATGARKYLNQQERGRVLAVMQALPPSRALFALTLAWTGGRVSEVLALSPSSFQVERGVVALITLKRRRHVVREVPIPPELVTALEHHFHLSDAQRDPARANLRLWSFRRETAWRAIKRVMLAARVSGSGACPRGLRHAFGVGTLQAGIPLNLAQRWLGHARISTTAIYAAACGPEEQAFAARFWRANDNEAPSHDRISRDRHARRGP